jgi:hypothetical protein
MNGMLKRHGQKESSELDQHVVANSTVLNIGDPVTFDTDGFIILAGAGLRIEGVSKMYISTSANNETVAEATLQYEVADIKDLYEMDASGALADTNRSMYADVTGTTGAIQLDHTSVADDTGQLRIKNLDPREEGSTTRCLVNIAEWEYLSHTQN